MSFKRSLVGFMLAWLVPLFQPLLAQEIQRSPRIAALEAAIRSGDSQATAAFWSEMKRIGTPLFEPVPGSPHETFVTFVWRAEDERAMLNIGVDTPFNRDAEGKTVARLSRLKDTDVWYRTYRIESTARFPYGFLWPQGRTPHRWSSQPESNGIASGDSVPIIDGTAYEYFRDPLALKSILDAYGDSGELKIASYADAPEAPPEPWLTARAGASRGQVTTRNFESRILGNTRTITIYTPPGYSPNGKAYPFVLAFDGSSFLHTLEVPKLLDHMIDAGVIPPLVAILVDQIDIAHRSAELPPNERFGRFLVEELLPTLRQDLRLTKDPARSIIAGASYGGLAATWIARDHPEVFGAVLSQSGSFWWAPEQRTFDAVKMSPQEWVPRQFAQDKKLPLRFYLDVGTWEGDAMLSGNRHLRDVLQAKGYELTYREFTGGHTFLNWRASFPDGLISLMGTRR
ncbi:alpha/beta hydrolase-fold protein [Steroidobacter sp.]|uniref:alpha/beta hydrolase-fold protein n=1 Tax=Steroidobacter sp. TaxID=1978227 RepID=UPI001A5E76FC|nr:alpha/beta hydrolase-fold protein [Steroidobacter sp.]MBL8265885.1 DUF3327 domain-containing protein [Steroidobacter sp.]